MRKGERSEAARALGRRGGLARAANMTAEQRSEAAREAARALWRSLGARARKARLRKLQEGRRG